MTICTRSNWEIIFSLYNLFFFLSKPSCHMLLIQLGLQLLRDMAQFWHAFDNWIISSAAIKKALASAALIFQRALVSLAPLPPLQMQLQNRKQVGIFAEDFKKLLSTPLIAWHVTRSKIITAVRRCDCTLNHRRMTCYASRGGKVCQLLCFYFIFIFFSFKDST